MSSTLYDTQAWRDLRQQLLDGAECALAHLAGDCRGALELHHVEPIAEGGPAFPGEDGLAWLCKRHHRALHGFRNRQRKWKTCPHKHHYPGAREACEARLNA